MEKLQFGTALTCNLYEKTITLEVEDNFTFSAGEFAIIKIETLDEKIKLEEFIESLKK